MLHVLQTCTGGFCLFWTFALALAIVLRSKLCKAVSGMAFKRIVVVRAICKAKWLLFLLCLCLTRQLKLWYSWGLESSKRIGPCKLQNLRSERSASVERLEHSEISFLYFLDFFFNVKIIILTLISRVRVIFLLRCFLWQFFLWLLTLAVSIRYWLLWGASCLLPKFILLNGNLSLLMNCNWMGS